MEGKALRYLKPTRIPRKTVPPRHRSPLRIRALLHSDPNSEVKWTEDIEEVSLRISVNKSIQSKSVHFTIHPTRLDLSLEDHSILSGTLDDVVAINIDGCYWFMDDERESEDSKCLTIVLQKMFMGHQMIKHLFDDEVVSTEVTNSVFLEISIDEEAAGVLILGLYGNAAPNATENFTFLVSDPRNDASHNSEIGSFVQILANKYTKFEITGQDFKPPHRNPGDFKNESRGLSHDQAGMLSMDPKDSLSDFTITFNPALDLDQKSLIFGRVTYGMELLSRIESLGDADKDSSSISVKITSCGVITDQERAELIKTDQRRQIYQIE